MRSVPHVRAVFDAASEKYTDVTFAKLDTEAQGGIAAALEIQSIPTLMAFVAAFWSTARRAR